jgi:hypothetical protein
VSSVHSGACDATHAAILKPGTADCSRRRARRAICGTPGVPSHSYRELYRAIREIFAVIREERLSKSRAPLFKCPYRDTPFGRHSD